MTKYWENGYEKIAFCFLKKSYQVSHCDLSDFRNYSVV